MALELENEFRIFQLEGLEYREAVTFTTPQKLLLQSYIGEKAAKILQLNFSDEYLQDSLTQHKYLTGQLDILRELLGLQDTLESSIESNQSQSLT